MTSLANTDGLVGIDVSKSRLDVVASRSKRSVSFANTPEGHARLVAWLRRRPISQIGLEPTGNYERALVMALHNAGLPVRRVDSYRVRQFAKASGRLAKTDRLDAGLIRDFLASHPAASEAPPCPGLMALRDLVAQRRALLEERNALRARQGQLADPLVQEQIRQRLDSLAQDLRALWQRMKTILARHAWLRRRYELIVSARGVGEVTGLVLLAHLPELGRLTHKQLAALTGLAPIDRQSGRSRFAAIHGGRGEVRSLLYLCALIQIRRCPRGRAFYERLRQRGKPPKQALIALAHKTLRALNAMIRKDQTWQPASTA